MSFNCYLLGEGVGLSKILPDAKEGIRRMGGGAKRKKKTKKKMIFISIYNIGNIKKGHN